MWWGTVGSGCGMPFGMLMMPMLFLIIIAILFYTFSRRISLLENHQFSDYGGKDGKDEILKQIQELKEEIHELKKEKE